MCSSVVTFYFCLWCTYCFNMLLVSIFIQRVFLMNQHKIKINSNDRNSYLSVLWNKLTVCWFLCMAYIMDTIPSKKKADNRIDRGGEKIVSIIYIFWSRCCGKVGLSSAQRASSTKGPPGPKGFQAQFTRACRARASGARVSGARVSVQEKGDQQRFPLSSSSSKFLQFFPLLLV